MPGLYPHRCNIQIRTKIADGQLGPVENWIDNQTNVPCKFEMMSADMVLRLYGEAVIRAARLWLPRTATIHENTYQVTTNQGIFAGTWIVKAVKQYDVLPHWEVDLIPDLSTTAGQ